MPNERPGIEFEKIVAALQARFDPASTVTHNEVLVDRLRQSRQFDVVIRGQFSGQQLLGVIECKDLNKKVGTPEVDAFNTKSTDINANFKILMSRRGFTEPAIKKCQHYGIQTLSLIERDPSNQNFRIGTTWYASLTKWHQIGVTLHYQSDAEPPIMFKAEEITIGGKKVMDWFTNYLVDNEKQFDGYGWIAEVSVVFDTPQPVQLTPAVARICNGITFKAERILEQLEHFVGIVGDGFYDWQKSQAIFPPNSEIQTVPVPGDFSLWKPRKDRVNTKPAFIELTFEATSIQFERISDAIALELL